jgi:branched-subunit amino acid aminotransferase/4-amino-4-deoxychorismate lyase
MTEVPATAAVAAAEVACLDGAIGPASETRIPVVDEGFLRGDGVFEVVRVYDGRPFALSEHLDRLERSAANLRLGLPVPRAELESDAAALLEARGGSTFDGLLRFVLTRGGHRLAVTEPLPPAPDRARLGFVTFAPVRVLDGVKSLSYASNMLAGRIARERGFDEALLVTPHGRVLEAPTASVFWVTADDELATPPLDDHILASITRAKLMEVVPASERPLTTEELLGGAREVFLVSTVREVQPVHAVEDRDFDAPGERTRQAATALRERIAAELRADGQ